MSMSRLALVTLVVMLAALSAPLLAHGGSYVPPSQPPPDAGQSGPGSPTGGSWKPPADSGSPSGSSPSQGSGARAGAPQPRPTSTGSGVAPSGAEQVPSGVRGHGCTTGGPAIDSASAGWQYWWEFNKDQYLALKSRGLRLSSQGGSVGHLTGRGRHADPDLFVRPEPATIRGDVLPLLLRLLADEHDRDIVDSSMLALARTSGEETAQFVIDALLPFLAHKERGVQCAAALSLGVLHSPRAVPALTELMRDSLQGRRLARAKGPVDRSVRACAALGLGLVNEPDSVDALCALLETTADSDDDLKSCAIAALGLTDNQAGPQALSFLLKLLEDRRLNPAIKSHVPPAIGKLCQRMGLSDPVVERALLKAFGGRDTDALVRPSLAIALGLVGGVPSDELEQDAVLGALLDCCAAGRDDATRELCFIAVAQIGARDSAPLEHPRVHQALRGLFIGECLRPTVASDRAWAALGAGIYGQVRVESQAELGEALTAAYSAEGDPSYKGSFALALGLLDDRGPAGELFADLRERQDQELNGFTALSLGFMGYRPAAETLRGQCQAQSILPLYRMRLATSLALLADDGADEALIALLGQGHAVGVNAAAARSLGLIGGEPALRTLSAMAADPDQGSLARAFACVAIGMICEKTELPWNARLSADSNFRCLAPTLREALDIL